MGALPPRPAVQVRFQCILRLGRGFNFLARLFKYVLHAFLGSEDGLTALPGCSSTLSMNPKARSGSNLLARLTKFVFHAFLGSEGV